jgi:carboxymethylenebutenolidase
MRRATFITGLTVLTVALAGADVAKSRQQQQTAGLPAGAADVVARLKASPRHGEWVTVKTGQNDSVRAYLVYPERRTNAPVVLVIHEIFGLSNWVRGVADQLAADGFIAIAPDLLTMSNVPQTAEGEPDGTAARNVIGSNADPQHQRRARLVAEYAMSLPAAQKKYGIVGYCWGGAFVWQHAVLYPDVAAGVSYYGQTANPDQYAKIKTPILGLYGSNDQRVNATIPRADSAMKAGKQTYEPHTFEGAAHGFLRAQEQAANLEATKQAWPLTVGWFRKYVR